MGFLQSVWNAVTWLPRQAVNLARGTVSTALSWGSNIVGNTLQSLGVSSIATPYGVVGFGGREQTAPAQPSNTYFGQQQPQVGKGTDWGKILMYGGIAVVGVLVVIIILKTFRK